MNIQIISGDTGDDNTEKDTLRPMALMDENRETDADFTRMKDKMKAPATIAISPDSMSISDCDGIYSSRWVSKSSVSHINDSASTAVNTWT
jgi:hypothetical protein